TLPLGIGNLPPPRHPALGNRQSGMGNRGNGEWGGRFPDLDQIEGRREGADCLTDSPFPIADSQGRGSRAWSDCRSRRWPYQNFCVWGWCIRYTAARGESDRGTESRSGRG